MSDQRTERDGSPSPDLQRLLEENPSLRRAVLSGIPAAIKRELNAANLVGKVDPRVLRLLGTLALAACGDWEHIAASGANVN